MTANDLQLIWEQSVFIDLEYIDSAEQFACYVITGVRDNDNRWNEGEPSQWNDLPHVLETYASLGEITVDYRSFPDWGKYERALEELLIKCGNLKEQERRSRSIDLELRYLNALYREDKEQE